MVSDESLAIAAYLDQEIPRIESAKPMSSSPHKFPWNVCPAQDRDSNVHLGSWSSFQQANRHTLSPDIIFSCYMESQARTESVSCSIKHLLLPLLFKLNQTPRYEAKSISQAETSYHSFLRQLFYVNNNKKTPVKHQSGPNALLLLQLLHTPFIVYRMRTCRRL